jgi:hypothetical protein
MGVRGSPGWGLRCGSGEADGCGRAALGGAFAWLLVVLSSRRVPRATGWGGRVVPAQHPHRPQGVPPARCAVGFLEPEVDRAGVGVLEQPKPSGERLVRTRSIASANRGSGVPPPSAKYSVALSRS